MYDSFLCIFKHDNHMAFLEVSQVESNQLSQMARGSKNSTGEMCISHNVTKAKNPWEMTTLFKVQISNVV